MLLLLSACSPRRGPAVPLVLMMLLSSALRAQTIVNPGFESGTTGWSGCPLEINPSNVYGGPDANKVAEVDGDNNPSITTDDRQLCQTISGFTIGSVYTLEFYAARRQGGSTPVAPSVFVTIDGVLDRLVTRTGGWNMQLESFTFTAASATHTLHIRPNFTVSYGMLFDNFSITLTSPLPVELLYFDARTEHAGVALEWATATERNNALFVVERSTDHATWTTIATIPGAGDSQVPLTYQAHDAQPVPGLAYYRLKQIDHDGTEDISDVKAVRFDGAAGGPGVWPNPASDLAYVHADDAAAIEVVDRLGRRVQVPFERTDGRLVLHVGTLPGGHYLVRNADGTGPCQRFVKL